MAASNTRKPAFLSLIILLLALLPACSGSGGNPSGNAGEETTAFGSTAGNTVNGGLLCESGGWIYFRSEADGWHFYKARLDGQGRQKLADDIPEYINVVNDWIYFANYSDGHKLYKMKTDGTEKTKLNEHRTSHVNVVDGSVYYINWDNEDEQAVNLLCRTDVDGSSTEVLYDKACSSLITDGRQLYVTSNTGKEEFSVFRISMSGEDATQLTHGHYCHFINSSGDYIFYWNVTENRLRRMNKDGTENVVLLDVPVDYVNANGQWVYFTNAADRYNIYRVSNDGSILEKLTDIQTDEPDEPSYAPKSIFVGDGSVFYRGFASPEAGDALFVVKAGTNMQEIWDGI